MKELKRTKNKADILNCGGFLGIVFFFMSADEQGRRSWAGG